MIDDPNEKEVKRLRSALQLIERLTRGYLAQSMYAKINKIAALALEG